MSDFENRNEENFFDTSINIGEDGNIRVEVPKKNKKKRKGMLGRVLSITALGMVMALGGGIIGSRITYNMLSSQGTKNTNTSSSQP